LETHEEANEKPKGEDKEEVKADEKKK